MQTIYGRHLEPETVTLIATNPTVLGPQWFELNQMYIAFKYGTPVANFGGTVAASQQHISTVNGNSFFFSDAAALGFTPFQGGGYSAKFTDAAGVVAWSKIKAAVPGGLTVGAETYLDPSFDDTTKWGQDAGWTVAGGLLTASAAAAFSGTFTTPAGGIGTLFLVSITCDSIASGNYAFFNNGAISNFSYTTSGTKSEFLTATFPAANFSGLVNRSANTTAIFSAISRKAVTIPPATGVILVNAAGAETMINLPSTFNPTTIASVLVYFQGN